MICHDPMWSDVLVNRGIGDGDGDGDTSLRNQLFEKKNWETNARNDEWRSTIIDNYMTLQVK